MTEAPGQGSEFVSGEEIAELFRRAIRLELKIFAIGGQWNEVYAGNVRFRMGEYQVVIFNDCDSLDYVDSVIAPDGRMGDFDAWFALRTEPVSLLNDREKQLLQDLLDSAPLEVPGAASTDD
jgi:2,3-bisphosphoglycerate-dependent phosphoglycerate mutase